MVFVNFSVERSGGNEEGAVQTSNALNILVKGMRLTLRSVREGNVVSYLRHRVRFIEYMSACVLARARATPTHAPVGSGCLHSDSQLTCTLIKNGKCKQVNNKDSGH